MCYAVPCGSPRRKRERGRRSREERRARGRVDYSARNVAITNNINSRPGNANRAASNWGGSKKKQEQQLQQELQQQQQEQQQLQHEQHRQHWQRQQQQQMYDKGGKQTRSGMCSVFAAKATATTATTTAATTAAATATATARKCHQQHCRESTVFAAYST